MKRYRVTNSFHNTEAITTLTKDEWCMVGSQAYPGERGLDTISDRRRARRLDRALCPHKAECTCGGFYKWTEIN